MSIQHTLTVRVPIDIDGMKTSRLTIINCPPYLSNDALDVLLTEYKMANPTHRIISKSWSANLGLGLSKSQAHSAVSEEQDKDWKR